MHVRSMRILIIRRIKYISANRSLFNFCNLLLNFINVKSLSCSNHSSGSCNLLIEISCVNSQRN